MSGITIFGIVTALLASIHFAFRKWVYRSEAFNYRESVLIVAFVLSTFALYASSPFIHMYTPSLSEQVEQYFAPILCVHVALVFIGIVTLLVSLTPFYKRILVKSKVFARNFYAFVLAVSFIALVNLTNDVCLHNESIGRQYDFQVRKGVNDYKTKEQFQDLNSDLNLLESWIRSAIWTPWILLLILGSTNFSGLMQAMRKT